MDFRDPRRDKTHGRIWRVTAKGRDLVNRPKLMDATIPELLERLKDPEDFTRLQAKRVLKERGKEKVLPELAKWVTALPAQGEHARLEAMRVYQAFGSYHQEFTDGIDSLRNAKEPSIRASAIRIISRQHEINRNPNIMPWLQPAVTDDSPRVRLEAVRAMASLVHNLPSEAVRGAEAALDS